MKAGYMTQLWDVATGLTDEQGKLIEFVQSPKSMLERIRDNPSKAVVVLRDLHKWLDPMNLRMVRSLARKLQDAPVDQARTMIVLTPVSEIPPELAGSVIVLDWPLPTREDMADLLQQCIESQDENSPVRKIKSGVKEAAVDAAVGLTMEEACSCLAKSLAVTKTIDPVMISTEKKRVIAREKVLTWIDPDPRGLDSVGGLAQLKAWLRIRRKALSKKARDYGLPVPKGAFFVGPPGCGKSMTAKAIAAAWMLPLLRLDLGALRSKWVGESEANIRKALSVAETVAPCILWIDEIEKAMGGAGGSGVADGGVSTDALGAILNWMQEHTAPVFVVATANDVSSLPPELLRKGRFDELFFIDLPSQQERIEILSATLKKYNIDPSTIKLDSVAAACNQFSGAELAALVPDAMFTAFNEDARALKTSDLMDVVGITSPLAKIAGKRIEDLRSWSKGRCRPASVSEEDAKGGRFAGLSN